MAAENPASVLVVDNYDSFTFNLVHAVEASGKYTAHVCRRDSPELTSLDPFDLIIFSPGPGLPGESPELMRLIDAAVSSHKPVLGVCLGHQALAVHSGAALRNLGQVHHGVAHTITVTDRSCPLFSALAGAQDSASPAMEVGRYHSWVVDGSTLPAQWRVTCRDSDGEVMGMRHLEKPLFGVQFHPESIMTPEGRGLLGRFLEIGVTV